MSAMPFAALQFMFDWPLHSHTWPISTSLIVFSVLLVLNVIEQGSDVAAGVWNSTSHFVS